MSKTDLNLTPTRRSKRKLALEDEKSESPKKVMVTFVSLGNCGLIEVGYFFVKTIAPYFKLTIMTLSRTLKVSKRIIGQTCQSFLRKTTTL
jgi:hypothetical protein